MHELYSKTEFVIFDHTTLQFLTILHAIKLDMFVLALMISSFSKCKYPISVLVFQSVQEICLPQDQIAKSVSQIHICNSAIKISQLIFARTVIYK